MMKREREREKRYSPDTAADEQMAGEREREREREKRTGRQRGNG